MPLTDMFKSQKEIEDELKRKQKREMREANRSVERIQADLDRQAKELESQIKVAASKNNNELAKTLAKQLIKVKNEKTRAMGAKSKLTTIASQASFMQTNNKLAQVMANSAAAMSRVNQSVQPDQLAKTLGRFQEETTKMDMKDGMMEDMFEELFEGEQEEADEIMNQVLSELSIETSATLSKAPATAKDALKTATSEKATKAGPSSVKNP